MEAETTPHAHTGDPKAESLQIIERLELLAACTEETGRLTRTIFTPAMRDANAHVAQWMTSETRRFIEFWPKQSAWRMSAH